MIEVYENEHHDFGAAAISSNIGCRLEVEVRGRGNPPGPLNYVEVDACMGDCICL
jgi:hypothetical protein